jgi:SAM-dependent methyltransferase
MTEPTRDVSTPGPTLSDQVSRLYEIIGGFHATNLLKIAQELGVWRELTNEPGLTSEALAGRIGADNFYTDILCRTAFSFALLDRLGDGWRMAPHFDQILGDPDSTFYLGSAASVHMLVGEDYAHYIRHFRDGTRRSYQAHNEAFMAEVAQATVALPRIFLDYVLPRLPTLEGRLSTAGRLLDLGCGSGWAVVQIAERYPDLRCDGVDVEPYSVEAARRLIGERGLSGRCEARLGGSELAEPGAYDVVTSFLVIHEIDPAQKAPVFADIARALKPGGAFLIFDEAYPETDEDLRQMPKRFAALAQWYEVTWGNRVSTRSELVELCTGAGLEVTSETAFSRFHIILATKPARDERDAVAEPGQATSLTSTSTLPISTR